MPSSTFLTYLLLTSIFYSLYVEWERKQTENPQASKGKVKGERVAAAAAAAVQAPPVCCLKWQG